METWKRALLRLFSSFEVDVTEDYPRLRRVKELFGSLGRHDYLDWQIERPSGEAVPVRIFPYEAEDARPGVIVYFHGGGWVTGSIDSYTSTCATLADALKRTVVSVDYRLAPEHPFPAGFHDCYDVTARLFDHADALGATADEIILAGDSAGGNLAAAVAQRARDEGHFRVRCQMLFYPALAGDYEDEGVRRDFPSLITNGEHYGLSLKRITDYMTLYVPDREMRHHPYVAPIRGDVTGLPATLVITAEYDPLRDEGEAYAKRLEEAGIPTRMYRISDTIHGFLSLPMSRATDVALEEMEHFLEDRGDPENVIRTGDARDVAKRWDAGEAPVPGREAAGQAGETRSRTGETPSRTDVATGAGGGEPRRVGT